MFANKIVMPKVYLTKEKCEELKKELQKRKSDWRLEISERLKRAKEHGDLSENADYAGAKEARAANERRILELESILGEAEIINNEAKNSPETVEVGCKIKITNARGVKEFTILGSHDSDPKQNLISNESPMGRAFLGRKVGEEVEVSTPAGLIKYKIISIE